MLYKQEPQVISTSPSNHQNEVATTATINITFNTDIHRQYLTDSIKAYCFFADNTGDASSLETIPVEGDLTYKDRVLTFTPKTPLKPGMVYHVTVISDGENGIGIRNVLGDFMLSNYSFTFSTVISDTLPAVQLVSPVSVVIKGAPTFDWVRMPNVKFYHIEVSRSNTFDYVHWAYPVDVLISQPPIRPEVHFDPAIFDKDGIYYWRIQANGWHGEVSAWSNIGQFNIDRVTLAPVVPEDVLPEDPAAFEDSGANQGIEILEVYPQADFSNVATNLKAITIRVAGRIDPTRFTADTIRLLGEAIDDSADIDPHGEIKAPMQVTKLPDGTTLIALILQSV